MARIFISYSSKDKAFVLHLATSLTKLGHIVWYDEWEIHVGDLIPRKIAVGIENAEFVAVVLSKNSTVSSWVDTEWQSKYWEEVNKRRVMVLPILLEECVIPTLLRPKKYADFREHFEIGFVQLVTSLQLGQQSSGIVRYYSDFVDIKEDWLDLFKRGRRIDLLMMYSATWRNTYYKHIADMISKPDGRLRIILPELHYDQNLLRIYARRLEIKPKQLLERYNTAITEYSKLSEFGRLEIYTVDKYFNHACYLFEVGGIFALYSYKSGRVPTPACLVEEGSLLDFLRDDFEWLVSDQNPTRRVILYPQT